jgi:nucleoside-diphosphate-sugar epimerase
MIAVYGKGKYKLVQYPPESRNVEIGDYIADWSKFKNEFGWKPDTSIVNGLSKTIRYYKDFKQYYW